MSVSKQYLDGTYISKNPSFHMERSPWKANQICKMMERNHLHPKTICEIGCGAGEILNILRTNLDKVDGLYGFEVSPQAYELCKQRETGNLKFYNSDLLEQRDAKYDLVLCIDVFEHVEDCFGFLRRLKTHGNHFIFHIPLDMNVQMVLRAKPILYVREKVGHIHYFSKDTALAALNDTGYHVIDWFYTSSGYDNNKSMPARLFKLPRLMLSRFNRDYTARILGGYSLMALARPKEY